MSISLKSNGQYANTLHALKQLRDTDIHSLMVKYAQIGVEKLLTNTPKDSGVTSESWYYNVVQTNYGYRIEFCNSNKNDGTFQVAWFIEYGHATRNGGWVQGNPYLSNSLNDTFDELVTELEMQLRRY